MGIQKIGAPISEAEEFTLMPDAVYGSGADGDVVIESNTTITRDMNYRNLTVEAGITLNTGGYKIFVRGNLILETGAVIGLPNGSTATGTLAGGSTGSVTNSLGGNGNAGTATAPSSGIGGAQYYNYIYNAIDGFCLHASQTTPLMLRGGAGGSGSTAGGGVVVLCARKIYGSGTIKANGAVGAGGGVIILVSSRSLPSGVATDVSGGTGGSAGTLLSFTAS